ncbi:hypothetical protein Tco_0928633 [Tanacetum coccineum]
MSRGVFALKKRDEGYYDIPLYSRFKQSEYKAVPNPLSDDYTPREQEDIDDSLYVYGKYGPQIPSTDESDAQSSNYSTCPTHDSSQDIGTSSDKSVDSVSDLSSLPMSPTLQDSIATQKNQPQVPIPKKTVDPSYALHVKTPRQPIRTPVTPSPIPTDARKNWNQRMERELGEGYSFERKKCFVCGSLSHLIKDCDYYEKKLARPVPLNNIRPNLNTASINLKTGRVNVNTGIETVKPVSSACSHNKSGSSTVNTGMHNVNSGSLHVNSARQNRPVLNQTSNKNNLKLSPVNVKSLKKCFSNTPSPVHRPFSRKTANKNTKYAVKGKVGTAVKTSAGCVWRKVTLISNTNSGPTLVSNLNVTQGPQDRPKPVQAWVPKRH